MQTVLLHDSLNLCRVEPHSSVIAGLGLHFAAPTACGKRSKGNS